MATSERRAYMKRYAEEHREQLKEYYRRRYAAGLSKRPPPKPCVQCGGPKPKGKGRRYCDACDSIRIAKRRAHSRAYDAAHREEMRLRARANYSPEKQRAYRARTAERQRVYGRAAVRRRKARKRDVEVGDLAALRDYDGILRGDPCSYCCARTEHTDHIEAIADGGADAWENLTAACASCNSSKRTKPLLVFMALRHV